jgi:hypothetical protein
MFEKFESMSLLWFFFSFIAFFFIHLCNVFETSFTYLPSNPLFFFNCANCITQYMWTQYKPWYIYSFHDHFRKLVKHTFELNFEMNSNEFCMVPCPLSGQHNQGHTRYAQIPNYLYNKYFSSIQNFPTFALKRI